MQRADTPLSSGMARWGLLRSSVGVETSDIVDTLVGAVLIYLFGFGKTVVCVAASIPCRRLRADAYD
jgi:hypothetical protein